MPNLLPLYLYSRYRQGVSVESLANELGISAEVVSLRLEAARLCFDYQCSLNVRR